MTMKNKPSPQPQVMTKAPSAPELDQIVERFEIENNRLSNNLNSLCDKLQRLSYYDYNMDAEVSDRKEPITVTDVLNTKIYRLENLNEYLERCLKHLYTVV